MYANGVKVQNKNKALKKYIVRWVCGQLVQGKGLDTVLPVEPEGQKPDILAFMKMINSDDDLKKLYEEAKTVRYNYLSEQLITAVNKYKTNPRHGDAEAMKAMNKAIEMLEKGGINNTQISIEVVSNLPKDFWRQQVGLENKPFDKNE